MKALETIIKEFGQFELPGKKSFMNTTSASGRNSWNSRRKYR